MNSTAAFMEMLMMICFGLSWPMNIRKAWKAKSTKGTSLFFYSFIWIGYMVGIISKFILIHEASPLPWYDTVPWYVLFFYILNIAMVTAGIFIYFRNRKLDRSAAA